MTVTSQPKPPAREPNGHFAKGNSGGPGRTPGTLEYRAAVKRACTPEQLEAVITQMVTQALDGDVAAAKLILERLLGAPKLQVDEDEGQNTLSAAQALEKVLGLFARVKNQATREGNGNGSLNN